MNHHPADAVYKKGNNSVKETLIQDDMLKL